MGQRGPAPTPTSILEKRGSWLAKTRDSEPIAEGSPTCPDWLQGEGRNHWFIIIKRLTNLGIVGEIDEDKLAMYCSFYILFLNELGKTDRDPIALTKYATMVDRLGSQFGMSPSARANMAINKNTTNKDKKEDRFFRTVI